MKNVRYVAAVLFIVCGTMSIMAQKKSTVAYHEPGIECLGIELDGSQTLRSYGRGRNKTDAVEQARKNAVRAVLFYGIQSNGRGCETRPLITEANAEEKYEDYFHIFFADRGEYKEYVSSEDEKNRSKTYSKTKLDCIYCVTVRILRSKLKARLKADNVIK